MREFNMASTDTNAVLERTIVDRVATIVLRLVKSILRVASTMILMGLSLLPLSALLLSLPVVNPDEAVLADTIAPTRSFRRRAFRRLAGLLTALALLIPT